MTLVGFGLMDQDDEKPWATWIGSGCGGKEEWFKFPCWEKFNMVTCCRSSNGLEANRNVGFSTQVPTTKHQLFSQCSRSPFFIILGVAYHQEILSSNCSKSTMISEFEWTWEKYLFSRDLHMLFYLYILDTMKGFILFYYVVSLKAVMPIKAPYFYKCVFLNSLTWPLWAMIESFP